MEPVLFSYVSLAIATFLLTINLPFTIERLWIGYQGASDPAHINPLVSSRLHLQILPENICAYGLR